MKEKIKEDLRRWIYGLFGGMLVGLVALKIGYTTDTSAIIMIQVSLFIYLALKLNSIK